MQFHHVRGFLTVAEERSFRRAAERLHMAQPPLSRTIQQLERQLGARLFDRTTRSVRLTPAGEALLEPARAIEAAVQAAEQAVASAGSGEIGRVRVGFAGPSSHNLISALARHVRQELPGIDLALSSTTFGSDALAQLTGGDLDVAIVRWDTTPPGMQSRVVRIDRYVIVLPDRHRLAERDSVSMPELADEPWVLLKPTAGSTLTSTLMRRAEDAGFTPRAAQYAPDTWTILALVAAGVGITMTVDTAFNQMSTAGIRVASLDPGSDVATARLCWRVGNENSALRRVLELSESSLPTPPGY